MLTSIEEQAPYFDSLGYHFHQAPLFPSQFFSTSAYENLKNAGLDLIRNKRLKNQIIDLYEVTYPRSTNLIQLAQDEHSKESMRFYLKHFARSGKAIPNSYDDLMRNQYFQNLLIGSRSINWWSISINESLLAETKRVRALIESELE